MHDKITDCISISILDNEQGKQSQYMYTRDKNGTYKIGPAQKTRLMNLI